MAAPNGQGGNNAQEPQDEFDPFAELDTQQGSYARPRKVNALERGKVYKVVHVLRKQSEFSDPKTGQFPMNTVVHFFDGGLKFSTILPKMFNNKTELWEKSMNKLIGKNMNPKLVYYGRCGMGYEVELLRHTEDPKPDRLKALEFIEKSSDNQQKRSLSSDFEESPKKIKLD